MITEEKLIAIIENALENRAHIDCVEHAEHHRFISEWIEEKRISRERWSALQSQVLGWGIIAFLGWMGMRVAKVFGL